VQNQFSNVEGAAVEDGADVERGVLSPGGDLRAVQQRLGAAKGAGRGTGGGADADSIDTRCAGEGEAGMVLLGGWWLFWGQFVVCANIGARTRMDVESLVEGSGERGAG